MLSFRSGVRIYISTEPTDMRPRVVADGTSLGRCATVDAWYQSRIEHSEHEALRPSGTDFVFTNRRQTLLKLIYWDTDGILASRHTQHQYMLIMPT